VLAVTFIAGFTAPLNMAKIVALAPQVMETFGIEPGMFGTVVALFFILGFLLAFPTAAIIKKLGLRTSILTAVACGFIGSVVGWISISSGGDLTIFMVSRFLEGAGMGILGVAGASAIAPWFPAEKRGFPLGIWAIWVAAGMVVGPILFGQMFNATGSIESVWIGTTIFDVVAGIIFLLFYRDAPAAEEALEGGPAKGSIFAVLKNGPLIALGLIFLFDEMAFMTINGFFTAYVEGPNVMLDVTTATLLSSLFAVSGAIFAPLAGKISDVLKTRKWVLLVGLIVGVIYTATVFNLTADTAFLYWPMIVIAGIVGGMVPSVIWIATPETVEPEQVPAANAVVATTQNFGMCIGSLVMGNAIEVFGYSQSSFMFMVPLYIICIIVLFVGMKKIK
jgi:MFS family permease